MNSIILSGHYEGTFGTVQELFDYLDERIQPPCVKDLTTALEKSKSGTPTRVQCAGFPGTEDEYEIEFYLQYS